MKFARYEDPRHEDPRTEKRSAVRDAAVGDGDRLHDLGAGQDIDELLKRGGRAALLAAGAAALVAEPGPAAASVRLLPPLHPASIRDSVGTSSGWRASSRSASSRARTAPTRSARTW